MIRLFVKVFLFIILLGCHPTRTSELTIAVASNMQFAMEELIKAFEIESGINCETVVSSSGKLTAQILAGAPMDILVSADVKYPQELYLKGFTKNQPAIYAYGKLVLWSKVEGLQPSIEALLSPQVKHIAIPNPKTAPYGFAAMEVLRHHGLLDTIEHKLVYGESISQTNQFIISESAEIGFTAKSVVLSNRMRGRGQWTELDQHDYLPIEQGVVVINNIKIDQSTLFYNFLFAPEGQEILVKFGYTVPGTE